MRVVYALLIAFIFATLTFIFVQSTLPEEVASKESSAVTDVVLEVVPPTTPAGGYVEKNMGVIAHFVEFAVLGLGASLFVALFSKSFGLGVLVSIFFGQTVAIFDETIQIFSGRAPEIQDVWTDIFGFITMSILVYAAYFCYRRITGKKEISNG